MTGPVQTSLPDSPGVLRRRWRSLSARTRTLLVLALWIVAWQAVVTVLRLMDDPALSEKTVTMLDGETTTLAALADGKPLVVNLWATWCPPCRREMPVFAAAQQRESAVTFVFANQAETRATVRRYLAASALELDNVALDPYTELSGVAGSGVLPATLFYDASGRLVDTHLGALSAAALDDKLARLRPRP
ncbi:MAG: TlpA family protein disulfide reductase [Thiobacillus sp.]|nr:TlpA family protein disulfide reductase [Thiobacillus sp.]